MAGKSRAPTEGRLAGAGAGTGLIGVIAFIPDTYAQLKQFLTFLAPTATVMVGWSWVVIRTRVTSWISDRELEAAVLKAIKLRDQICSDPSSTEKEKESAIKAVADLKALQLAALREHYERVKADLRSR